MRQLDSIMDSMGTNLRKLGDSREQRSLARCSPRACKELGMTQQLRIITFHASAALYCLYTLSFQQELNCCSETQYFNKLKTVIKITFQSQKDFKTLQRNCSSYCFSETGQTFSTMCNIKEKELNNIWIISTLHLHFMI